MNESVEASSSRRLLTGWLVLIALLSVGWITLQTQLTPPAEVPADAPPTEFSAERAFTWVEMLAQAPHPVGTREHHRVRNQLVSELRQMGFDPQIQVAPAVWGFGSFMGGGTMRNVLARLPGQGSGNEAVLLMAHYDTRAMTPGAADDTSGCAVILETLRALRAGGPLERDVIALFTDGEETGLLGARAFAEDHGWMDDVVVALNIEARGNFGPTLAFETSGSSTLMIEALAASVSVPWTSSLAGAVYRMMPNDTDFSIFRDAGVPGVNVAFLDGYRTYHTMLDTPEGLDRRSFQHQGEYILGLARHFGAGAPVAAEGAGQATFFNVWGHRLAIYPVGWALPIFLVALALVVLVFFVLRSSGVLASWRTLFTGSGLALLTVVS
ncbi:MAG: M20/M25/M40 family metallo-hydrolase, partial [Acidobacteriota bacterium]